MHLKFNSLAIILIAFHALSIGMIAPASAEIRGPVANLLAKEVPYPNHGVEVGTGWNSFLGQKVPAICVDIMEVPITKSEYTIDYEFIHDTHSMAKSANNAGSGKFKGFGFKASVSASNETTTRVNRDYLSALFSAEFNFGSTQAIPVLRPKNPLRDNTYTRFDAEREALRYGRAIRLTQEARAMVEAGQIGKFIQTCGDSFVSAVHRGVRTSVLATLQASSQSSKQKFAAAISAKGFGGAATYTSTNSSESDAKTSEVLFQVYQEGGLQPVQIPSGADAKTFDIQSVIDPENLLDGQSSFSATVIPYATLLDFAGNKNQIDELALYERLDQQRSLFYFLTDLEAILAEIDQAETYAVPDADRIYSTIAIEALSEERDLAQTRFQVFQLLRVLRASIESCYYASGDGDELGSCDPSLIEVQESVATAIKAQLDGAAVLLEQDRAFLEKEIERRIETLAKYTNFLSGDVKTEFSGALWSAASTSSILEQFGDSLTLNVTAPDLLDLFNKDNAPKDFLAPMLANDADLIRFRLRSLVPPDDGDIDLSPLARFALPQAQENDIKQRLAEEREALSKSLDDAKADLEALRVEALGRLAFYEANFAPLVDFTGTSGGACQNIAARKLGVVKTGALTLAPSGQDETGLQTIIDSLKAAQPCRTIGISDWISTLYDLAAVTPLTKEQLAYGELQGSKPWLDNAGEETAKKDARSKILEAHIRRKIYAERLYPFRESLCQTSIHEAYCVNNGTLKQISNALPLVIKTEWLGDAPVAVTIEPPKPRRLPSSGCPRQVNGRYVPWDCP